MADISELVNLPIAGSAKREDYVIIDSNKEIKQVTVNNLLAIASELIPIVDKYFPDAITLKDAISQISTKLNTLESMDVAYDGEIHQELSNVRAVLLFLLDKIDDIYGGSFDIANIAFNPTSQTPDWVITDLEGKGMDMATLLNYILSKYQYTGNTTPGDKVIMDITGWNGGHSTGIVDDDGKASVSDAINRLYWLVNNEANVPKYYYKNNTKIAFPNSASDVLIVSDAKFSKGRDGVVDINVSMCIHIDVPGTLTMMVYNQDDVLFTFNDALTTGDHIISPKFFHEFTTADSPLRLAIGLAFIRDTNDDTLSSPAYIDANNFMVTYEGIKLSYIAPTV